MRRSLRFRFEDGQEALLFIKLVTSRIKSPGLAIKNDLGNIEVTVEGAREEIELYVGEVLRILRSIKGMKPRHGDLRSYDMAIILDLAGPEAAFPLDLVAEALGLMGRYSRMRGNRLITNSTLNEVLETVRRISRLYLDMRESNITPQAKRIISLYALLTGKSLDNSIEDLVREGILNDRSGFLALSRSYNEILGNMRILLEGRLGKN